MSVNNNYFRKIQTVNEQFINIPIELTFDMEGREDLINQWEDQVIEEVLNPINDFEITKFAHKEYNDNNVLKSAINYEFYFFDYLTDLTASTITNWNTDYENASFTDSEIYYFANSFKGSFFKLDFYDSNISETQTILLSVIYTNTTRIKRTRNYWTTT